MSSQSTNTFRYFMPPGRTYLFQAADEFEMNEWINLINYASAFKTADIRMRHAVLSKDRASLAGAAAAASHKRERPHPGTTISKSPRKAVFGTMENNDSAVVSDTEASRRPRFIRLDSATSKAAVDVSPADAVGQEPTENLEAIFDVVKADLAAGRKAPRQPTQSPPRASIDDKPERVQAIEVRCHIAPEAAAQVILQAQIRRLQEQAKHMDRDLHDHVRVARNIALLTPFQRSSREQLAGSLPSLAHKIRQSRLHLVKVQCWIDVLQKDLDREQRDWYSVHHLALQAANKALHDGNGIKAIVQDVNEHARPIKPNRSTDIPTLSLSSPAADDSPVEVADTSPLTPNLDFGESDLLGRSPGELPIVIRRPSEDDSRRKVSRASSGSFSGASEPETASGHPSGGSANSRDSKAGGSGSHTSTANQTLESRVTEHSTPMMFSLSDA